MLTFGFNLLQFSEKKIISRESLEILFFPGIKPCNVLLLFSHIVSLLLLAIIAGSQRYIHVHGNCSFILYWIIILPLVESSDFLFVRFHIDNEVADIFNQLVIPLMVEFFCWIFVPLISSDLSAMPISNFRWLEVVHYWLCCSYKFLLLLLIFFASTNWSLRALSEQEYQESLAFLVRGHALFFLDGFFPIGFFPIKVLMRHLFSKD